MCRTCRGGPHLDGGVIFIHKVVLDELDGECTLAHASSSHHHQLILRHLHSRCCSPHTPLLQGNKGGRERCRLARWQKNKHCHNHWQTQLCQDILCHWTAMTRVIASVARTKHSYYHYCLMGRNISGLCACVLVCVCLRACEVGAEVETLRGECEKCAEGTQCSNPLPLSVSSSSSSRQSVYERRERRGVTLAGWSSSLRLHITHVSFEPKVIDDRARTIR